MKKLLSLCFSLLFLAGQSQSPWTLEQCIKYAISHNINLQQTAVTNETYKNNATQAEAATLPSINAGASHVYNFGQTIDRFTNKFASGSVLSQNFYLSSSVVLWSGLSQYNNIKSYEYNYLSGVERLKQQQYDLALNVANAYIGVIFQDELLKISQSQYDVSKQQMERTQKLVDAGAAAKSVGYDIKAQLANDQVNLTTADNNYYLSLLSLRQLMNLDSVPNFNVVRPELNIQEAQLLEDNVQYVYENSLKSQPSIKSGEYAMLSAEKYLAATRGKISPSLSFNASMGTGTSGLAKDILGAQVSGSQYIGTTADGVNVYSPTFAYQTRTTSFGKQFKENVNKSLGFTLTIPIFNGLQTNTAIKNAKLSAYNTKLSQDLTKQNLYKNIAQAHANAKAALNKYNATQASVEAATESFKYAQEKFNAGVISAIDFSTAKNRQFAAESNMLQAKYDYVFKLKVLDYYQGKPLGF